MSIRLHGITLPDTGVIQNFKVNAVTDNPSVTDPGYIHYNSTLKDFIVSYNDGSFNRFITESTLTDKALGLDRKKSVRVATTETVDVSNMQSQLDDVELNVNDRILVKNATPSSDNGIYKVDAIDSIPGTELVSSQSYYYANDTSPTTNSFSQTDSNTIDGNYSTISDYPMWGTYSFGLDLGSSQTFKFVGFTIDKDYSDFNYVRTDRGQKLLLFGSDDNVTYTHLQTYTDFSDGATDVGGKAYFELKLDTPATYRYIKLQAGTVGTANWECNFTSNPGYTPYISDFFVYEIGNELSIISRSEDADNSPTGEVTTGMYTIVNEGTVNGSKGFILVTPDPITLGTTDLSFTQWTKFGDVGIDPNGGLYQSGSNISILKDPSDDGLTLSVSGLKITDDWIKTDTLGMLDIPDVYGTAEQVLRVNATTDGFDFADDPDTLVQLGVPAYVANNVLVVNETTDGFILTDDSLLQAEVDNIQAAAGLETTGSFSAYSGSSYLDTTTSLTNATSLYDTAITTNLTNINNQVYNITTSTPATQHTINHALGTQNIYTSVYVYDSNDSKYHRDYPDIEIVDDNNIVINMVTSSNIKVVIKSLEGVS